MTTIDDATIVKDILDDNWIAGNVAKPVFYIDDSIKNHDYRRDAIKVYVRSMNKTPLDVGYSNNTVMTGVSIDIRCSNRSRMLQLRDEAERCLLSVRKSPDSNYSVLIPAGEKQVAGYSNFWHYVYEITLLGRRAI